MVRVNGHFGEWMQGLCGADGPLVLVTVPCPALAVSAERLGDGPLALDQVPELLPLPRAARFLDDIGAAPGRFRLRSDMPPGGGAGASTAALLALAEAAGSTGADLAAACLAVEGASDPLMLPAPDRVLWAPRGAKVVAPLAPLPRAEIVGGFWGAPVRTDPSDLGFPDIADLIAALHESMTLGALAGLASEAARRCTALRGPVGDPMAALAASCGALGHLRAHTGSARGLIFAPGTVPPGIEGVLAGAGLTGILRFRTGRGASG